MKLENEIAKLADKDLNSIIKRMVIEGSLDERGYEELMKKDRDTKEVVAYIGYLEAKKLVSREKENMESLTPISRKVVATVKKDLERIRKHGSKKFPKISTTDSFLEVLGKEDKLQKQLNKDLGD